MMVGLEVVRGFASYNNEVPKEARFLEVKVTRLWKRGIATEHDSSLQVHENKIS